MRAVIQRASSASVTINNETKRGIGAGFVILLGVGHEDSEAQAEKLWKKIFGLRIFADSDGKTNLNLSAIGGGVLIVSQFTLYANCRKGNRPSFIESAAPDHGKYLYQYFVKLAHNDLNQVETGEFGADMQIELINDGPFTIVLDTDTF